MTDLLDEREDARDRLFELRGGHEMDAGNRDELWTDICGMDPSDILAELEAEE